MKKRFAISLIALCMLASFSFASAEDDEVNSGDADVETNEEGFEVKDNVVILTNDNFDDAVKQYPTLLVEFFAPWCGHCKSLAPEYAAASEVLLKNDPSVVLASVDATVHSDLAQRFEVGGYPTLRFFKNGKDYEYDGPRQKDGIVDYMKGIADPSWAPEPEAVVTLTQENFKDMTDNEELMLVEFYAPWCGHCKRLAPTFEKAAKQLKREDPPIILAKVDATEEKDLAAEFGVTGYPTMKIFKKGKSRDYTGGRNSEYEIISYMLKQKGDGARQVENLKDLKKFFNKDDITIVGFFSSPDDILVQPYKDVADELREDYTFGIVYDEAARKAFKVNDGSVVIFNAERFYTKFEPKWHVLSMKPDTDADAVKSFITKHNLPLVGHYSTKNSMSKRYDSRRPLCMVFYSVDFGFEYREVTQMWRNKIAAIAKQYPDITFAVADDEEMSSSLKEFGLDDSGEEMNIGLHGSDKRRYPMEAMDEFDSDHIKEFLDSYKKGKLTPFVKSQIPPKKQGAVTTVVGKTFDKIVLDETKDVLIEMYAPWCGHCKSLEPIYLKLAKKLKSEKNLVIAKLDATANDIPDSFSVSGFPTIYFAPATSEGKKTPLKYEGGRDLESFENYLKENAVASFKGKDEL